MADKYLARIIPYNPAAGYKVRRYHIKVDGRDWSFDHKNGWYEVTESCAKKLKTIHAVPGDKRSPKVFEVYTEKEAKAIDVAEQINEEGASLESPIPIPADLQAELDALEEELE